MKGIQFSGGMDSTIMAYELFATTEDEYIIYTLENGYWPPFWSPYNVHFIINKWFNQYKDRIIKHVPVISFASLKDLGEAEYRLWAKFMHDHKLTDLFCGTTKVYSECIDHSLNYPSGRWNLDQMKFGNCVIHQPYYNLHRHDIVNKYLEYDVLEMLFDTQSCAKIASDGVPCNKISCEQCSDRYEGLKRAFTNTKYEYIIEQDRNRKLEDVEWTKC